MENVVRCGAEFVVRCGVEICGAEVDFVGRVVYNKEKRKGGGRKMDAKGDMGVAIGGVVILIVASVMVWHRLQLMSARRMREKASRRRK